MIDGSACRHAPNVRRRGVGGSDGSSRETSAPLGATVLEYGATGAGAHAGTETVLLGTALAIRLKCTLHDSSSSGTRYVDTTGRSRTCSRCTISALRTRQGYGKRVTRGNHREKPGKPGSTRFRAVGRACYGALPAQSMGVVHRCGQPCVNGTALAVSTSWSRVDHMVRETVKKTVRRSRDVWRSEVVG